MVLACGGCHGLPLDPPKGTFLHSIPREQLVLHSDFHLPERHRLVEELVAERQRICDTLALQPSDEPVQVYLFNSESDYQAHVARHFPEFPLRRAIFVETDVELAVYAHWGDHVAEDLRHEVAHGYLHSMVPHLPLWLDEGLAEYFEVGRGQRGVNRPHVELLVGQAALGNWKPDLARLESLTDAGGMTQLDYAEAWAWVHFLLNSPDDKRSLLTDYLAELRRDKPEARISTQINRRLADAEAALLEHVRSFGE
jgi:hypothetical protein